MYAFTVPSEFLHLAILAESMHWGLMSATTGISWPSGATIHFSFLKPIPALGFSFMLQDVRWSPVNTTIFPTFLVN